MRIFIEYCQLMQLVVRPCKTRIFQESQRTADSKYSTVHMNTYRYARRHSLTHYNETEGRRKKLCTRVCVEVWREQRSVSFQRLRMNELPRQQQSQSQSQSRAEHQLQTTNNCQRRPTDSPPLNTSWLHRSQALCSSRLLTCMYLYHFQSNICTHYKMTNAVPIGLSIYLPQFSFVSVACRSSVAVIIIIIISSSSTQQAYQSI